MKYFNHIVAPEHYVKAVLSFLLPAAIILWRPIGLTTLQAVVLGTLFLVILWWGSGWVQKDAASVLLLLVFLLFGNTPTVQVLNFICSENLFMIVASYLLSAGIVNTGIAERFSQSVLQKYCKSGSGLVVMAFILMTGLIFIIPQPFPRVVLLSTIYSKFLDTVSVDREQRAAVLFSIFVSATVTALLLLNGDVIANYAAMEFGGVSFSYVQWLIRFFPPTAVMTAVICCAYLLVFRKNLNFRLSQESAARPAPPAGKGTQALITMAFIIVLWLTESFHNISAAKVAVLGVVIFFLLRIIRLSDFKTLSPSLLLFLTAEFAIGKTLIGSGVAEAIRNALVPILPAQDSVWFLPVIVLIVMGLHMIMGSLITALSFSIPMVILLTEGLWSPEFVVFLVLAVVTFHFLMPFHNIAIMIGYGSRYYENRHTVKFGLCLTALTIAGLFLLYLPWWENIVG